jgi:hypothetical protein
LSFGSPSPGVTWRLFVVVSAAWVFVYVLFPLAMVSAVTWFGIQIERNLMSEVQNVVDAITAQLVKVRDEIVTELEKVATEVHIARVDDEVDLSGLQRIVDALDAIVPDAVDEAEVEVAYEGLDEFAAAEDELVDEDEDSEKV